MDDTCRNNVCGSASWINKNISLSHKCETSFDPQGHDLGVLMVFMNVSVCPSVCLEPKTNL